MWHIACDPPGASANEAREEPVFVEAPAEPPTVQWCDLGADAAEDFARRACVDEDGPRSRGCVPSQRRLDLVAAPAQPAA